MTAAAVALAVCAVLVLLGAISDALTRRIPNMLCLVLAAASLVYTGLANGLDMIGWSLAHGVLALIGGMALFAARVIGGGDAKFYAAAAFAIPLLQGATLIAAIALSGLVLLVLIFVYRTVFRTGERDGRSRLGIMLPYGVAIAAGWFVTLTYGKWA